eukprot:TRINITY_DN5578_c0_g5_i2.p1 TRINITY_DN5578_c0_g5~~TRINITY_DN5578_c0_g5_i2.p1  ORF type:complete len:166 (+),score=9.14 TRINITY_DN5578_c0_g5_i2:30-500(+)
MSIYILLYLAILSLGNAMVLVGKLPVKAAYGPYSEELWVYLSAPILNTNLYLFYEKDVSQLELVSSDEDPRVITSKLSITKQLYNENSRLSSTYLDTSSATSLYPARINQWTHFAVTVKLDTNFGCNFYVNGMKSPDCDHTVLVERIYRVCFEIHL